MYFSIYSTTAIKQRSSIGSAVYMLEYSKAIRTFITKCCQDVISEFFPLFNAAKNRPYTNVIEPSTNSETFVLRKVRITHTRAVIQYLNIRLYLRIFWDRPQQIPISSQHVYIETNTSGVTTKQCRPYIGRLLKLIRVCDGNFKF